MAQRVVAWDDTTDHFVRTTKDPSDIVPGSGTGGAIPDIVAAGSESVTNGATSKAITFSTAFSNTSYAVIANLVNTTDSSVQYQPILVTAKSTTGFTANWNVPTDSANYLVDYIAVTPCSNFKANVETISNGVLTATHTLLSASTLAVVPCWFNSTDSSPLFQPLTVTTQSTTQFADTWNTATDSANYVINWAAVNISCPTFKSGIESLSNGATSIAVTFPFPALNSSSYALVPRFANTVDSSVLYQPITITSKSISGFTAKWNSGTDSANYQLEWIVHITN
jgi:hypothetical protein